MAIDFNIAKMPYSMEAEQAVLGAVILDPEKMSSVADFLVPEDFYIERNASIFKIMAHMFISGKAIDVVTLLEEMRRGGVYDEAQSKAYIMQLAEFVPTSENIEKYARIVWEKSMLRALIDASGRIAESCVEEQEEFTSIIDAAERRVYEITQGKKSKEFVPMLHIVSSVYDRMSRLATGEAEDKGIPTGFADIDSMIGGLNKSDLIILAARPGIGKTSLALNFAQTALLNHKKKVAFFSLEMSKEQLVTRLLSSVSGVPGKRIARGEIRDNEWETLARAADVLSRCELKIDDNPLIAISEIKAKLRREKDVDLVVVDYLQLMSMPQRSENRVQEISSLTRNLKITAKELNLPIVVLSQLSRPPEARRESMPLLSDLRESGSIEQDADIVIMLYRDMQAAEFSEEYNIAKCRVAKNRHGETGDIELGWNGELTRFTNLDRRHDS